MYIYADPKSGGFKDVCRKLYKAVPIAMLPLLMSLASCDGLDSYEKTMVGKYYNTAISDTNPVIELNKDRTSVLRASRPGEITYSVKGRWHGYPDSLVVDNDPSSITIEEGDPAMVGHVAEHIVLRIKSFNESTMTVDHGGLSYDYHRRPE